MRWLLLTVALCFSGCQYHTDCDTRVRDLYPGKKIESFDVGDQSVVYWIDREIFVECYYGAAELRIHARTPVPWKVGYCRQWSNYTACMKEPKGDSREQPQVREDNDTLQD